MPASEFDLDDSIAYLNHAAIAPWPRRTVEAVQQFAQQNGERGSQHYARWLATEQALREQLKTLINAHSSNEIALLKSTSEALSVIAYGLDWRAGDKVVIPEQEFPSNRIVWESLQPRGVEVVTVNLDNTDNPEQALIAALDSKVRLVSVSSVQYASGLALNLDRLGQACQQGDILFCVDAIQSLGARPFDVQRCHADFVVADGHKWMLGPEGLALFYCRQPLIDRLRLNQYGWHMVEAMGEFDRTDWSPATSACRFECGSPNMLGIHALHASLSLLLETGIDKVASRLQANTRYLLDRLRDKVDIVSPLADERRSGILTIRTADTDLDRRYRHLQAAGVICALRGGGIRFSPHFYTSQAQMDKALRHLFEKIQISAE